MIAVGQVASKVPVGCNLSEMHASTRVYTFTKLYVYDSLHELGAMAKFGAI